MGADRTVKRGCREEPPAGARWENASIHQLRAGGEMLTEDCAPDSAPRSGGQGPRGSAPQHPPLSTGKIHGRCSTNIWVFKNPFNWIKETRRGGGSEA